jgi:hypothetical protein
LGHPFLATTKAIIYADAAKIVFTINGRKDPDILTLKNTSQLSRRREETEGGIRTIINLNRM